MAHPLGNIRGSKSSHLAGRRIVLAVSGSIAAVKTVELARELARHGADVQAVMSPAATRILHPDALHFATGNPVVTRLTGAVEHVALLGDVPEKMDMLLVAPATANTVSKMALGIDDSTVTTCATVAFGTGVPVVVAPAMHEAMLDHVAVTEHAATLQERFGVTWVAPRREEHKAKLAEPETIAEAVIHRLAQEDGPLAGKRCLVVGGATAEPVDAVRILTNRSSGRSALVVARELRRLGADLTLWHGQATVPVPEDLEPFTTRFAAHAGLAAMAQGAEGFDVVWMPAAIADYTPVPHDGKIPSGQPGAAIPLRPVGKIIEILQAACPQAQLVAFKAEATEEGLETAARDRLERYGAMAVVANAATAFSATDTRILLVRPDGAEWLDGPKDRVLADVVRRLHA